MPLRYVNCDVLTDRALAGNQLAVFPEASDVPEELLQALAREINFAETVFVYPPAGKGDARIRIFTPAVELPFAGHPCSARRSSSGQTVSAPRSCSRLWGGRCPCGSSGTAPASASSA